MSRSRRSRSKQWRPSYFNDTSHRSRHHESPRRIRTWIRSTLLIVILLLLSWAAYLLLRPAGRTSQQECYAYITDTTSSEALMTTITKELEIKNPTLLRSVARLVRIEERLRPGRYRLSPDMSILSICKTIKYGAQTPVRLSFSSIRTQEELIDKLTAPLEMSAEELRTLLRDSVYCDSLGFTTETIRCMFLPDTHEVYWTVSPKELLHKYEQSYHKFWDQKRTALAQEIGLTPVEVSIIASIVEEESSKTDEYGDIARLYINRLRKGMALQADPTLKFATGNFTAQRIGGELLKADSPYNTYKYKGLPPGPIRYPQMTTLDAVLHHTPHDYLYMCARADFSGHHAFAANYAEHMRNARAYQKALDERGITE